MINIKKLSFKNLQKLSVQQRIEAIKTPGIGQFLMSALTPTQIAELFPRYYLMNQPDISGFLKALPTGTTAAKQAAFQEQLENTTTGDAAGKNMEAGGWRRKLQEGVSEQTQTQTAVPLKPGQVPQPRLTPEQMTTVQALQSGEKIPVNDERVKFITTLTPEQLKSVGLEKFKDEGDKEFYKYIPPVVTDEEAKKSAAGSKASGSGEWARDKAFMDEVNRVAAKFRIKPNDLLAVMANESGIRADKINNRSGATGLIQFMPATAASLKTSTEELRQMSRAEQMKWVEKYFDQPGNTPKPGASVGEIYAKVFLPARAGKEILATAGEVNPKTGKLLRYYEGNRGFDREGKGYITQQDITNAAIRQAKKHGVYTDSTDEISKDYTAEQIAAEREKLVREINTNRIQSLSRFSQANLPVPGSPEAQKFLSEGKSESAVRKRISELTGMESRECVALAKAYVGSTGTVRDWRRGSSVLDGNLQPGTPIATFMDREGNPSQYYDGGVGTGKRKNDTTHAAIFLGYERDQSGKITGIRVADQWATSNGVRYRTYPIEGNKRITSAKNFYAINDTKGEPLGESNPMRAIKQAEQHQGGPKTEAVADSQQQKRIDDALKPSPDVAPGARPAPQGLNVPVPIRREEEAKPVEQKAPEPPKVVPQRYKFSEAAFVAEVRAKEKGAFFVSDEYILNELRQGFKDTPGVSYKNGVLTVDDPKSPAIKKILKDMKDHNFDSNKFLTEIKEEKKKEEPKPEVKPVEAKPVETKPAEIKPEPPKVEPPKSEPPKAEPPTIKKFVKGEGYAGLKDVPNPNYVPPKVEPKPTESTQQQRVNEALKPSPDVKAEPKPAPKGQNTPAPAPEAKPVENKAPAPPVKTNARGGENETNTSQISAMPIGGLKDDNSLVVDANQKPLFTMNTDKESAIYNPRERKVDVIPKDANIGRTPSMQNDLQSEIDGLRSDLISMRESRQQPGPKDITRGSESHISDRDSNMIETIMDMSRHIFLDPTAARAFSRARFVETGDATNDFHHSGGNSNMKN